MCLILLENPIEYRLNYLRHMHICFAVGLIVTQNRGEDYGEIWDLHLYNITLITSKYN